MLYSVRQEKERGEESLGKRIVIGSDHGGYDLKEELKRRLEAEGHQVEDIGCGGEPVDYPDIAEKLCGVLLGQGFEFGILCCGTGIGVSIAANKIRGIRAALCSDCYSARMAKAHNNANVITLGGRTVGTELAWQMVQEYMREEFLHGVHEKRVDRLNEL